MLFALATLTAFDPGGDLGPHYSHYWTLDMRGMTVTPEVLADGRAGLVLGEWELGWF